MSVRLVHPATQTEVDFVVENILGALIAGAKRELAGGKPPSPEALRKILESDLAARGWAIQPIPPQAQAKTAEKTGAAA